MIWPRLRPRHLAMPPVQRADSIGFPERACNVPRADGYSLDPGQSDKVKNKKYKKPEQTLKYHSHNPKQSFSPVSTYLNRQTYTSLPAPSLPTRCSSSVSSHWAWQSSPLPLQPPANPSPALPHPLSPRMRSIVRPKLLRLHLSPRAKAPARRAPLRLRVSLSLLLEAYWEQLFWDSSRDCVSRLGSQGRFSINAQRDSGLTKKVQHEDLGVLFDQRVADPIWRVMVELLEYAVVQWKCQ